MNRIIHDETCIASVISSLPPERGPTSFAHLVNDADAHSPPGVAVLAQPGDLGLQSQQLVAAVRG
jgi:hypothetical protein